MTSFSVDRGRPRACFIDVKAGFIILVRSFSDNGDAGSGYLRRGTSSDLKESSFSPGEREDPSIFAFHLAA